MSQVYSVYICVCCVLWCTVFGCKLIYFDTSRAITKNMGPFILNRREQIGLHVIACLLAVAYLWVNLMELKYSYMAGENKRAFWGEALGRR
jgi:hypothetical protein